ncbi:hypothetical protein ABW21_db0204208 [Orbilia brochopaga]|nr:hypothetical protein ABW21_db0204208 [Drechslerella brochopaga]
MAAPSAFFPNPEPIEFFPQPPPLPFILESQPLIPEFEPFNPESQSHPLISEVQPQSFVSRLETIPESCPFVSDETYVSTPNPQTPVGTTSGHDDDMQDDIDEDDIDEDDIDEDDVSTPRAPVQFATSSSNYLPPHVSDCIDCDDHEDCTDRTGRTDRTDFLDDSPFASNTHENLTKKCEQLANDASARGPRILLPSSRKSASAPNQKDSCDAANKASSAPELDLPVHTAQAPDYSVFKRLACSATCELCHDPPKLLALVAKENKDNQRLTKFRHKLGTSLLSQWLMNILNAPEPPQVNHEMHYTKTVNVWIEAQNERMTPEDLWDWILEETGLTEERCDKPRWWSMCNSVAAWNTFMEALQTAAPSDAESKHRSLDSKLMLRACRFLLVAIRLLETQEPEFLKLFYSLEFYIDMLTTAASFAISLFGYHDWITDGVFPSRLRGKPIWTWFRLFGRDLETCQSTQVQHITNFKQVWPWVHRRALEKSGRYQDNRPYYIPTMIVKKGQVIVNVGHIYITSISEHEEWCSARWERTKAYYRKYPERRPKIARKLITPLDPEEEKREAFLMGYCTWYRTTQKMPKKGSVFTVIPMRDPTPEDPWYEYCKVEEPEPLGEEPKPIDPYHDWTKDKVCTKIRFM